MHTRNLVTPDGVSLLHRTFAGTADTRRTAFVTHSQAQHTLNLRSTLEGVASKGWTVHATDLRGHGFSSGNRAPLAHMDIGTGWERLVDDLKLGLQTAFDGVAWEDRLVIAPNIGAVLVLEALKDWPDLARRIVFITPPPNQPAILKFARSFVKARMLFHPADKPDELTLHQLYTFLGARLSDRKRLIDVISSDREITDTLLADEYAWPTPTTGYFHEMFRGIEKAWKWDKDARVKDGTSMLILYGGDDPMTANGKFVEPMRGHLLGIGVTDVNAYKVEQGRSGLFIEEERFHISKIIDDWARGAEVAEAEIDHGDFSDMSASVLTELGFAQIDIELSADALVELCYTAIEDESRWIEMLYRIAYAISANDDLTEQHLEAMVQAIMPHWDRSYSLNRQIMQNAAIGAVLQNVVDRFNIGMAVVSSDMEISYANTVFSQTLARLIGITHIDHDDVAAMSLNLKSLLEPGFVSRCLEGSGDALLMVDGDAVGFHFRPKALRQTALRRGGASGVLILRSGQRGEDDRHEEKVEILEFAYGMTAKEAESALGLLDGLSPEAIAKRHGVSINTTRTHLKRVYEKVGVIGQTELTTKLLKGPIGLIADM